MTKPLLITYTMSHQQERLRDENTIKEGIETTYKEILEIDDKINSSTITLKGKIHHLAEQYEELFNREGFPEQVKEICSTICRRFEKQGRANLRDYVVNTLDDKYKRVFSEKSTSHLSTIVEDVPVESSVTFERLRGEANDVLNAPIESLTREHIQELWDKTIGAADRLERVCKEHNISLLKETDQNPLTTNQQIADEEAGSKVSQLKPANAITDPDVAAFLPYIQAMDKVIKDLQVIRQALLDYPIPDGDPLAASLTDSFNALHAVFEHSSDKKYRRSLRQWNNILLESGEQGGTSAASHSGVAIAGITDPKTGKPLFRNITKEQIDAIKIPMYNKQNFIIHNLPYWGPAIVDTWEHLERFEEGWRERRSEDLSPKLQKKA